MLKTERDSEQNPEFETRNPKNGTTTNEEYNELNDNFSYKIRFFLNSV